jgi:hypothetical protein
MNYQEKYIKYKNKYLELKNQIGGLVNKIPKNKLTESIELADLPSRINNYIKIITIPRTSISPVGSGKLKIQSYPSDIDIMNIVEKPISTDELIKFFIENLKNMINTINSTKNIFFSDFKAGGIHWSKDDILNGVKDNLSLVNACKIIDVIKIDIFAPYNKRYVEMSTFFILKSNTGFININPNYFDKLKKSLKKDIQHYKLIKPFKAVKRFWSLSQITNDTNTLVKLEKLINSNVSLLSQINADIETLELMVEKDVNFDVNYIRESIHNFKYRTLHILDIDFNQNNFYSMLDELLVLFSKHKENKNKIIKLLQKMNEFLMNIINRETNDFLNSINFSLDYDFSPLKFTIITWLLLYSFLI